MKPLGKWVFRKWVIKGSNLVAIGIWQRQKAAEPTAEGGCATQASLGVDRLSPLDVGMDRPGWVGYWIIILIREIW
jgi:hypothetical protein